MLSRKGLRSEEISFHGDHEEFRSAVRDFLARDVVPNVDEYAENKLIAREVWHEAGKQGILGLEIPEAYGGGEAGDYRFNAVATEELAAVNMALASSFGIHFDIVTRTSSTWRRRSRSSSGCRAWPPVRPSLRSA